MDSGGIFYTEGNIRSILKCGGWSSSFEAHEKRRKGLGLDRRETSDALLNSYQGSNSGGILYGAGLDTALEPP